MKRIQAIALIAIANVAMAGISFAQSRAVQAKVPFDFTVGKTLLPPGTYTIKEESTGLIVIRNRDKAIALVSLVGQESNNPATGGKLVFHRYGSQYFLSEILCNSADMNVRVPASKAEKMVQHQEAMVAPSGEIFIAAR